MDTILKELLSNISNLHDVPQGAYNIRKDGKLFSRSSTKEIEILPKKNKEGINIIVSPETKNQSIHIPVVITQGGFDDLVYNDFYIGDNSEITIIAGCGIHNNTVKNSSHQGIHTFHIGKNCKVKYIEKHLGIGQNLGKKILNPTTKIVMKENSYFEMETVQLGGVSYSNRKTNAKLFENTTLIVNEKILTCEMEKAKTKFNVELIGNNSKVDVISRAVAKDCSYQEFVSNIIGKAKCFGHVECDGILSDNAIINSTPKISAQNTNAMLVHEAAIGKISADQLIKLMSLGLSEEEAEKRIIAGFLS